MTALGDDRSGPRLAHFATGSDAGNDSEFPTESGSR